MRGHLTDLTDSPRQLLGHLLIGDRDEGHRVWRGGRGGHGGERGSGQQTQMTEEVGGREEHGKEGQQEERADEAWMQLEGPFGLDGV